MISKLSDKCCKKEVKPFPKLMMANDTGVLVLFTDAITGTAVNNVGGMYKIGYHSSCWHSSSFKDYEGDVCLTND